MSTSASSRSKRFGARSGWCPSRPTSSAARSPTTCGSARTTPPRTSCGTRSRWRRRATSLPRCRRSSRRRWTRVAPTSREASVSASPLRGPSSSDRASTCSTIASRHSMPAPMPGCAQRLSPKRLTPRPGSWRSAAATVIGPKIIGNATNVIFDGVIGKSLPAGITKAQAVAGLRAQGHGQIADLVSGANVVPGKGIDFTQLGEILALAALVYLLASGLTWLLSYIMAGVAQRTVYGLRRDAEAKLARLPLKYFDSHPHGDLLSRVTNDIDNITTTLQQGLSQFLTSTLNIVGILSVIVFNCPLLAAVALVTVPLSIVVTLLVARRSQRYFAAQWARTGALNGQVEQVHTGPALVQVFGRRRKAIGEFSEPNKHLNS